MNWIDANETLPEDDKKYLVWFPGYSTYDQSGCWVCRSSVCGRPNEKPWGTWYVPDGNGGYYPEDRYDSDVSMKDTFWMELPEAPIPPEEPRPRYPRK